MKNLNIVILAAGKGERMLSKKPKVLHEIMGKPLISYVLDRAAELSPHKIVVIVGYGKDEVVTYLKGRNVTFLTQTVQCGTAHAVLTAEKIIQGKDILVLYGDVPLITTATLKDFIKTYERTKQITFMTTHVDNPKGYGRVISEGEEIKRIVEELEATDDEKMIRRINTGICIIPWQYFSLLKNITPSTKKGEYYLTDICSIARNRNVPVRAYHHTDASEVLGINTRKELLEAHLHMRERILDTHMENGVTFLDRNIYIEPSVQIGRDTVIASHASLSGRTVIGKNVYVGPHTIIKDSLVHNNVTIEGFAVIDKGKIKEGAQIAFFSHITNSYTEKKDPPHHRRKHYTI